MIIATNTNRSLSKEKHVQKILIGEMFVFERGKTTLIHVALSTCITVKVFRQIIYPLLRHTKRR